MLIFGVQETVLRSGLSEAEATKEVESIIAKGGMAEVVSYDDADMCDSEGNPIPK